MRKGKRVLLAGIALATALTSACNGFGFNGEKESNVTMKLIVPNGEVFPYIDNVKAYLQAEVGANVRDYLVRVDNPNQPIRVEWSADGKVAKYTVEYATLGDYSNAILLEYPKETTDCELFNLYKSTKYYVRSVQTSPPIPRNSSWEQLRLYSVLGTTPVQTFTVVTTIFPTPGVPLLTYR